MYSRIDYFPEFPQHFYLNPKLQTFVSYSWTSALITFHADPFTVWRCGLSRSHTHTHTHECLNIVLVSCLIKCHNLLCGILRDLRQELWIVLIMLAKNFKCQIHLVSYLYNPIILLYGLYHLLVKIWTVTES